MRKSPHTLFFAAAFAALPFPASANLAEDLAGTLVQLRDDNLVPASIDVLEGKEIVAVYFSAHWCPPCRAFTPRLVREYNELVQEYPELELIFVSGDRSAGAMKGYMEWGSMTFPAVRYERIAESPLRQHSIGSIPYLIVLDSEGNPLIAKQPNERYLAPEVALARLRVLLQERHGGA